MTSEAFEERFRAVQIDFNNSGKATSGTVTINHRKGININVLAVVCVMLLRGVGKLSIKTLKTVDLEQVLLKVDYNKFDPYIKYLMEGKKLPLQERQRKYAEYMAMIVRYIYLLREIGYELESK